MKQNTLKRSKYLRTFFLATLAAGWLTLLPGAFAAVERQPCATNPQSRQLDFWLGDWTIGARFVGKRHQQGLSRARQMHGG